MEQKQDSYQREGGTLNSNQDSVVYSEEFEVRTTEAGTSWIGAVFLVVNAALGAGLLNFPESYYQAGGILIGIVIQAALMIFVVVALLILVYCSDKNASTNYQEVVYYMCGQQGLLWCSIAITLYCYGTCITFLIIIGDQWQEFFIFIDKCLFCTHPWYMNRTFTIVATSTILILPFCYPKKIDFLKYASALGVVAVIYVVIVVIVKYAVPENPPGYIRTSPESWLDVFYVIPTICFSYQCHVSVIPIYSCLKKRTPWEFSKTIAVAIALCVITYTVMATCGYLTFGSKIKSDILLSYSNPDVSILIAVLLIGFKTYTSYPILHFCGRAGLESLWCYIFKLSAASANENEKKRRIIMTSCWFLTTLLLAVLIPNIGVVIAFLGTLAAVFIFVFPGMCIFQLGLQMNDKPVWKARLAIGCGILFLFLGAFIFGVTFTQAVIKNISETSVNDEQDSCVKNCTSS
ncbi:putative sodium-coupled neutral amino acid transporter 7 [Argonauta hians]